MNDIKEHSKKNCTCIKCKTNFVYDDSQCWWDENGMESVKLTKCPNCGSITVVKYKDDKNLNVNFDKRYYS